MKYHLYLLFALLFIAFPSCSKPNNGGGGEITPPEKPTESGLPEIYLTGSAEDKKSNPKPGVLLAGGGSDVDQAMKWLLANADGGDVVVLRASGSDGYNNYLFSSLGETLNSVRTIVIDSRDKANKETVYNLISNAEALFIAGGDQSTYLALWGGSKVDKAIKYLIEEKGVTVGGTSAGMAILSQYSYSGERGSTTSEEALSNPYNDRVTIEESFISIAHLEGYITDTHFSQRERMGRVITFMARLAKEKKILPKAIACDEYSALAIDSEGMATLYGGNIFFIEAKERESLHCEVGTPLSWSTPEHALRYAKIGGNLSGSVKFNLLEWGEGNHNWVEVDVQEGELKFY